MLTLEAALKYVLDI